ncbi:MAG: sigma-70 family RNA polymerase sigma factor [Acetobacteraceae bacterium]
MKAEDPPWREWMRAAQAGDGARYAALLRAILPLLRRAARARWPYLGASEIEDVVQETLLALHTSRHLYDPARPFLPFLFGILRFRGADLLRRQHRSRGHEVALDDSDETSPALVANSTQEAASDRGALAAALARLPVGQRRAIEMTKLREMSLAEAAAASGVSIAALKVATHRGLKALRSLLRGPL